MSKTKKVDLTFFLFSFLIYFLFLFIFFYSIFRTRVRIRVTKSRCHTAGYKSHDTGKDVEGSGRMMSYNV